MKDMFFYAKIMIFLASNIDAAKMGQVAAKMMPRWPQYTPKTVLDDPRRPKTFPRHGHDAKNPPPTKDTPRCSKMLTRSPLKCPRMPARWAKSF